MPRNMAMQRPNARIIRVEFHYHISRTPRISRLQDLYIPPLRISKVRRPIPFAHTFGYNPEIVAVQVHGVRAAGDGDVVADMKTDGGVGAEIVDVPLGVVGVGRVA